MSVLVDKPTGQYGWRILHGQRRSKTTPNGGRAATVHSMAQRGTVGRAAKRAYVSREMRKLAV